MSTSQASQVLGLLFLATLAFASAQDVSQVLANYPQYSTFGRLLNQTGVLIEVNTRSSLTILLVENGVLDGYVASHPTYTTQMVADVLRYHVLLQYFGSEEIKTLNMEVVTTLYQTTGRANGLDGFVNVTALPDGSVTVGPSTPLAPVQATIVTSVLQIPYNYSLFQISNVLEPLGLAAAQLAPTSPPAVAPVPAPVLSPEAQTPVAEPTESPIEAPSVDTPVTAPSTRPVTSPTKAPVKAPVKAPTIAPTTPSNEPAADGPTSAQINSGFATQFNAAALMASLVVTALLF